MFKEETAFPHATPRLLVLEILIEFEVLKGEPKAFSANLLYTEDEGIFYLACESFDLLLAQDGLTKPEFTLERQQISGQLFKAIHQINVEIFWSI